MLRFEDIRVQDAEVLDRDFFNRRFRLIAEAMGKIDGDVAAVSTDSDRLVALGLTRISEVLGPLLVKLQKASEVGFLVAESSTPVAVSPGLRTTFEIAEDLRELFSPTPYLILQRKADGTINDFAALRLIEYRRSNGGLAVEVLYVNGSLGAAPHADWVISVAAGISSAIIQRITELVLELDQLNGMAAAVEAAVAEVNAIIAAGAVFSVNGKSGTVILGLSDIAGLVTALASKAESNHGHTIAQVTNLQSTLNAIADGGAF